MTKVLLISPRDEDLRRVRLALGGDGAGFAVSHARAFPDAPAPPGLSGFDAVLVHLGASDDSTALARIERLDACVPVIALAADDRAGLAAAALRRGAQDCLCEGQLDALLPRAIRHAIERHRLRVEARRAAHELRADNERFRRVIERNVDGVILVNGGGVIEMVNPAAEALLNRPASELVGAPLGLPLAVGASAEIGLAGAAGVAELRVVALESDGRTTYMALLRDITDRKRADHQERRHIAEGLHEHLAQLLAGAKINLGALKSVAPTALTPRLADVCDLIEEAIHYARSLTFDLSPPLLFELGFAAACEWLAQHVEAISGLKVEYRGDGRELPLGEQERVVLFQATRQLLLNVVEHAKATRATLAVRRLGDHVQVVVEDDGQGFDPGTLDRPPERPSTGSHGGFGLFNIREQLGEMGGEVQIDSGGGRGTRVTLLVPLKGAAPETRRPRRGPDSPPVPRERRSGQESRG